MKKQLSLVLETFEDYEEMEFIESFKKFIKSFKELRLTATHIKIMKEYDKDY